MLIDRSEWENENGAFFGNREIPCRYGRRSMPPLLSAARDGKHAAFESRRMCRTPRRGTMSQYDLTITITDKATLRQTFFAMQTISREEILKLNLPVGEMLLAGERGREHDLSPGVDVKDRQDLDQPGVAEGDAVNAFEVFETSEAELTKKYYAKLEAGGGSARWL